MKTVSNQTKSSTSQRIGMGLTAAERLQQLHDSSEDDSRLTINNSVQFPYRRLNVEGVAARRNQYLKETFRSQSPMGNGNMYSGCFTPMNSTLISR